MTQGVNGMHQAVLDAITERSSGGKDLIHPHLVVELAMQKLQSPTDLQLRRSILAYWNELLRGGVIGLGKANGEWDSTVCFVTDPGKRALEQASRDPINRSGYLAYLDQEVKLDDTTRQYIDEALNTYRACCYKATAVLVGAAVESLVVGLRDELVARLVVRGDTISSELKTWQAKTILEAVTDKLLPDLKNEYRRTKDKATQKLLEDADSRLKPVAAEFRKTRNDAGHPASLDPINPADVHSNLLLFPATAKLLVRLKKWVAEYYV